MKLLALLFIVSSHAQIPVPNVREVTEGTNYCDIVSGEYGGIPESHRASNLNYFFQCSLGRPSPYSDKNCPRGIQRFQIPRGMNVGNSFVDEYSWTTYRNPNHRALLTRARQQACQLLINCYRHRESLHAACPNDWAESIINYRAAFCARHRNGGTCHIPQGFLENAFHLLGGNNGGTDGGSTSQDGGTRQPSHSGNAASD